MDSDPETRPSLLLRLREPRDEQAWAEALFDRELSIPVWFWSLIANLLSKNPQDRIASAKELAELLSQCLAHVQQPTMVPLPKTLPPTPARPHWRRRAVWIASSMVAVLAILTTWRVLNKYYEKVNSEPFLIDPRAEPGISQPAPSRPSSKSDPVWEDGLDTRINALQQGVDELEQDVGRTP